LTDYPQLSIAA